MEGTAVIDAPVVVLDIFCAPGEEFNARILMTHIEGLTFTKLWLLLRQLQRDGWIEFTGRPCMWRRLK